MSFNSLGVTFGRGSVNNYGSGDSVIIHYYETDDTLTTVATASYFPDYIGGYLDQVKVNDLLYVAADSNTSETYRISSISPLTIAVASEATGNMTGPASSTDNAIARYDGTTGKLLQNSVATLSDAGLLTTAALSATLSVGTPNLDRDSAGELDIAKNNATTVKIWKPTYFPDGITFLTTGGTPTNLNYNEVYVDNAFAFAGPTATPQVVTLTICRLGRMQSLNVTAVNGVFNAGASFTSTTAIPARFRPTNDTIMNFVVSDNSTFKAGSIQINSTGIIEIFNGFATGIFTAVGVGFSNQTVPMIVT